MERQQALARQAQAENILRAIERPFAKKIYRATKQYYHRSLDDHLKRQGNQAAIFSFYKQQIYKIVSVYCGYSISKFVGTEIIKHKCGRKLLETKGPSKKQAYTRAIYQNYMHTYGAQQVRYITDTSRSDIQDTLSNPDATQAELTSDIGDLVDGMAFRSALIARTETHNAGQYAAIESVKNLSVESGTAFLKSWVCSQDERTRPTHIVMDPTNFIGLSELFQVGDSQMDRPGDPQGGPEEVCNCRCAVIMEEDGSQSISQNQVTNNPDYYNSEGS